LLWRGDHVYLVAAEGCVAWFRQNRQRLGAGRRVGNGWPAGNDGRGITRQTLSRELKVLACDGVIALGYGRIDIVSLAALQASGGMD